MALKETLVSTLYSSDHGGFGDDGYRDIRITTGKGGPSVDIVIRSGDNVTSTGLMVSETKALFKALADAYANG